MDSCPDILKDVFGVGGIECHVEHIDEEPVGVFGDESLEGEGVTGFDTIDQQGVFTAC